jgi:uncharacterized integral membrane protein
MFNREGAGRRSMKKARPGLRWCKIQIAHVELQRLCFDGGRLVVPHGNYGVTADKASDRPWRGSGVGPPSDPATNNNPQLPGSELSRGSIPSTRATRAWVRVIPGLDVLAITRIFVFQNWQRAKVSFFSVSARVPLSLALLSAAALGASVIVLLGSVRIVQLRKVIRRHIPTTGS